MSGAIWPPSAAVRCCPAVGRIAAGVLALAIACCTVSPAQAQDTPREMHQRAQSLLAQGDYVDAIPVLEQLIAALGDSKVASIVASLEMIYYHLALSHFLVGQFDQAEKGFLDYQKKYRNGAKVRDSAVYIADSLRFRNKLKEAIKAYREAMRKYSFSSGEKADMYTSIARCHLAEDKWHEAIDPLARVYMLAGDYLRRNWAATLLTTAYFKDGKVEKVYALVPFLLKPDSFASRSVAFNLAALEAADGLFADEDYREALWVYRMVYPYDQVLLHSQEFKAWLEKQADIVKRTPNMDPRRLIYLQESIAEQEEQIKALESTENYDLPLYTRIARGYMQALRYWEAREIFLHLHAIGDKELAEESLYLAFTCSMPLLPWDRAYELGGMYMEKYPGGKYFDDLTLAMGQMYAKQENWPMVVAHLTKSLEISPNHTAGAECMFLIGYASFMQEQFGDCIAWMTKMLGRYPESDLTAAGVYWVAMSHLFQGEYAEGGAWFDRLLKDHPACLYVEDSAFRRAVCLYGESKIEESDERLKAFMSAYPKSKLAGEAIMMRADIAGALGRLEDAVDFYRRAMEHDEINIEYYNHCAFQAGRILSEDEKFKLLREHFQRYLAKNREGSNQPQAIYWIGVALWNEGETDGAMRYYREAVEEYGKDPKAVGIDLILEEWVGRARRSSQQQAERAWQDLRDALAKAQKAGQRTLELRLKRMLLFDPNLKPSEKQTILNEFASPAAIPDASAAVLQYMLDQAREKGNTEFAVQAATELIRKYTETDYALDARMVLAQAAIEGARKTQKIEDRNKLYAEAIKHLTVVREVYASTGEAGQALALLGRLYFEQQKYDEADECYKNVLGVKDWRALWPECLYGRGECALARRQYDGAAAYYERIYLMYSHYAAWSAKAYLRRAECLEKAFQNTKAREVLEELLANVTLKEQPEYEAGRKLLDSLPKER